MDQDIGDLIARGHLLQRMEERAAMPGAIAEVGTPAFNTTSRAD